MRPGSLTELGTISGLGEKKLATYGEGVLEVLASFGEAAAPEPGDGEPAAAPVEASRQPAAPHPVAPALPDADPEFGWDEEPPEYE